MWKLGGGNSTSWLGREMAWVLAPKLFAFPLPVSVKRSIKLYCIKSPPPHRIPTTRPAFILQQSTILGPCHLPKFWGKKPKATNQMILPNHQWSKPYTLIQFFQYSVVKPVIGETPCGLFTLTRLISFKAQLWMDHNPISPQLRSVYILFKNQFMW